MSIQTKGLLPVSRTKKLFECPVEIDLAKDKAFAVTGYPLSFQILLRIRFFRREVRFFGTAISK